MKTTKISQSPCHPLSLSPLLPFSFSPFLLFSLLLLLSLSPLLSSGQSWERYDISNSGCSASFPYEPEWEISLAQDSSVVWVGEVNDSEVYYGIICIAFSLPFDETYNHDDLIVMAEGYLDYLQGEFNVVSHTGYETGYWTEDYGEVSWISDSWQDSEGDPWIIKARVDAYNLAVMYIYSSPGISLTDFSEYYFNSLRFPE